MIQNGITNDATGNLLRCGFQVFSAGAGETYRTDVPFPAKVEHDPDETNVTHWTGAIWDEVAQPAEIIYPSRVAIGTTIQRNATTPFEAALWCNTTTNQLEQYISSVWAAVGGGWEVLQAQDVTNQATVDFTTVAHFDGTYKALKVIFLGVNGTIDNVQFLLQFKVGGVFVSANYVYRSETYRGTVAETITSNSVSTIVLIGSATYKMGTGTNEKFDGEVNLGDPSKTDQDRSCIFDAWGEGQDGQHGCTVDGGGGLNDPGALEGLRFWAGSGNLNGRFILLGHKLT